jgi:hypothetical protein
MAGDPKVVEPEPKLVTDGDKVAITDEDGSVSMVARGDYKQALSEGARAATEQEWTSAKLGTSGKIAAGAVGAGQGLSLGYAAPAVIGGLHAVGADETAEDVRRGVRIAKESASDAYTTGEVAGALLPLAFGAGPAGAEEVVGSLGERALQRGIAAAPRALGEGAAIGVGQQATEDTISNHDYAASSYLTAAVKGGLLGLLLGTGGAVGIGAASDGLAGLTSRAASHEVVTAGEAQLAKTRAVSIDPDAGLFERAPAIEKPFVFGPKGHAVSLDHRALEGEFASGVQGGSPVRSYAHADLDAPLRGTPRIEDLFTNEAGLPERSDVFGIGRVKDSELFTDAAHPVYTRQPLAERAGTVPAEGSPIGTRLGIDADAGLHAEEGIQDVFSRSRGKTAPRSVGLGNVEQEGMIGTRRGIHIDPDTEVVNAVAASGAPRSTIDAVEGLANEQAFKSTGAKMGDIQRLGVDSAAQQAEMERIGARLRTETLDGKPLLDGPFTSQGNLANRIAEKTKEVAKSFAPMYRELDQAVARPSKTAILERFESELRGPLSKTLYGDVEIKAAEDSLGRLNRQLGDQPSFTKLWEARKEIDGQLKKNYGRIPGMPVPPGEEALRKFRGIVNDELVTSADRASKELGGTIGQKLKLANELYGDLAVAKKIATKESARGSSVNQVSLTDVIAGAGGGPGGLAMTAANMVRRHFGNQIASHVLGTAAKLELVQKAAAKIDDMLSRGTRSFIKGEGAAGARASKPVTAEEVRAIRDVVNSPDAVQARVSSGLGDMATYAPKLAAVASTRAMIGASWLRDNLPKEPAPTGITWNRPQRPMSDTELLKAGHIIETVEDPTIVVDRLMEGRLTREHVETLKNVHPEVYAQTVQYIRDHGEELRQRLTVQQEVVLSLLFGQPVSEAMLPANVKALQASFTGGSQNKKPGEGQGGAAPTPIHGLKNPGGQVATANDKIESGDA